MRIRFPCLCALLALAGLPAPGRAAGQIDRSKYVEVRPGEEIVITFAHLPPAPHARRPPASFAVEIEMDSAFRTVVFPELATRPDRPGLNAADFDRIEPLLPEVKADFYENTGDSEPLFTIQMATDGALGLRSYAPDTRSWSDANGCFVITPLHSPFRIYGFCITRNPAGTLYSTGDVRYSPAGWIAPDGSVVGPIQVRPAPATPPIPVGRVLGLSSDNASPRRPVRHRFAFATAPDQRYQLQSTPGLLAPDWRPLAPPIRAGATRTVFEIPLDRPTLFCRLVELGR